MADSNITCFNLAATGGPGQVSLAWSVSDPNYPSGLPNLQKDVTEIWASNTNNRAAATQIAETPGLQFVHAGLQRGQVKYYWVRPRNKAIGPAGQRYWGDWFPLSDTGAVVGTESNTDALLVALAGFYQIPNGLLFQWGSKLMDDIGHGRVTFPRAFTVGCFYFAVAAPNADSFILFKDLSSLGTGTKNFVTFTGQVLNPALGTLTDYAGPYTWMALGV